MKKDPLIFIEHVLESIENIESFMRNISKNDFLRNIEKQSAVIRQIEIIGEAIRNLPFEFKEKYPAIAWKEIAGMRDKLVHHYFGIDLNTIWNTVKEDIPLLKEELTKIKILEKK
jgi:uncharacterized protein with HEPN domain